MVTSRFAILTVPLFRLVHYSMLRLCYGVFSPELLYMAKISHPFCCSDSGKSFSHPERFPAHHKATRSGKKRYIWCECGKSCNWFQYWTAHQVSNTIERPFPWFASEHLFTRSCDLKSHRRLGYYLHTISAEKHVPIGPLLLDNTWHTASPLVCCECGDAFL